MLDWAPAMIVRVAILDMNNGARNIGIRNIRRIVDHFHHMVRSHNRQVDVQVDQFHVRDRNEIPDTSYHIYISSGGPGSPLDDDGKPCEQEYFSLIDNLLDHNTSREDKKFFFGICHSFQMMVKKFDIGDITQREVRKMGVVPLVKTTAGQTDDMLLGLADRFYGFDNRDWQVVNPDEKRLEQHGFQILSFEGDARNSTAAVTGIRFTPEIEAVQFHPEAEKNGILMRFTDPHEKNRIINQFGQKKYDELIQSVQNPNKLLKTYRIILPNFLRRSFNRLLGYYELPLLGPLPLEGFPTLEAPLPN